MRTFTSYVPASISELNDFLGFMLVRSPKFEHDEFPGQNLETVFAQLDAALEKLRPKLGDERFYSLSELGQRVRIHFEADPEDGGESRLGRQLIYEMKAVLKGR